MQRFIYSASKNFKETKTRDSRTGMEPKSETETPL